MIKYITKHIKTGAIVDVTQSQKIDKNFKKDDEIFPGMKNFGCETIEVDDDIDYKIDIGIFQLANCLALIENQKDKEIKFICRVDISFLDVVDFGKIGYIFDIDNERKYFISMDDPMESFRIYTGKEIEYLIVKVKEKISKLEEQIFKFREKMKNIEEPFDFCGIKTCKFFPKNKEEVYLTYNNQIKPCFGCIYYRKTDFYKNIQC